MNKQSLKSISEQVWVGDYCQGKSPLIFGIRMTVIRLSTGGLWIHSPIPITDSLADEMAQLGVVEHIVAPNCFHHLYAAKAKKRYPNAKLWAAPGLREKRDDVEFDAELCKDVPEWGGDIKLEYISGMPRMNEVVFFHARSQSLICSDFIFNIQNAPGKFMCTLWWLMGVWRKFGQSRTWRYYLVKDGSAVTGATNRILAWDFNRVIMAHGDIIDCNSRQLSDALNTRRRSS